MMQAITRVTARAAVLTNTARSLSSASMTQQQRIDNNWSWPGKQGAAHYNARLARDFCTIVPCSDNSFQEYSAGYPYVLQESPLRARHSVAWQSLAPELQVQNNR